jgi:peptidoglycan endopeptidase LytE
LRRRSLWLIVLAALLTTLFAIGKVRTAAAGNKPRLKSKRARVYVQHAADAAGKRAVELARHFLGRPYVYGGNSPGSGFDCSGLVYYVYRKLGIRLPRTSYGQFDVGLRVPRNRLQPGDLVFFYGLGHVGLYIGAGRFIHAPHTGARISIASMRTPWYRDSFVGARRVA